MKQVEFYTPGLQAEVLWSLHHCACARVHMRCPRARGWAGRRHITEAIHTTYAVLHGDKC